MTVPVVENDEKIARGIVAVIQVITSPATVKAFIVYGSLSVTFVLILGGRLVPDQLSSIVLLIVGSFFQAIVSSNGKTKA